MSDTSRVQASAPGFFGGVKSLFHAFGFLAKSPATWPYALVPTLVLGALLSGTVLVSIYWVFPLITSELPRGSSPLGSGFWVVASHLLTLGVFLLGALVAISLTTPLSGPALEAIVGARERDLGVSARVAQSFWAEIWCGLRAQLFILLLVVPVLALLWLVELLVPPLVVISTPLKLLVTSFALAWNLLDYPLSLRGVRTRERFELFNRYRGACLGFGIAFAALFWIPCGCQIVLLPVGAVAATDLVWQILRHDPGLAPDIARAGPTRTT